MLLLIFKFTLRKFSECWINVPDFREMFRQNRLLLADIFIEFCQNRARLKIPDDCRGSVIRKTKIGTLENFCQNGKVGPSPQSNFQSMGWESVSPRLDPGLFCKICYNILQFQHFLMHLDTAAKKLKGGTSAGQIRKSARKILRVWPGHPPSARNFCRSLS